MSTSPSTPNPFLNMKGTASEQITAEEQLRIAIMGLPKTGKSWLAATAPKPIRYYDHDNRAASLAGKPGLYITSRPTMLDVESDLSVMKANFHKKLALPATIVHDTVTYMNRAMEEEIFRQDPKLARSIKVGNNTSIKMRNSWDVINGIQRYVEYLVAEYTGLGVNLIFVFHEKDEKDRSESTATETKYTGLITVDPQYLQNSLSLFNEVYRITVDGARKYTVTCKPNYDVRASTTMLLDVNEPPDIMAMIAKHQKKRAELAAAATK
ncbi:MAG: AAA family ATPase [Sulfuriferula sp.]|nr:AAA family ATPase [Sulfuriferula sp.]